jgi:hypothetical protein
MSPIFKPQDQAGFAPSTRHAFDGSDQPQTVEIAPAAMIDRGVVAVADIDPNVRDPQAEIADRHPDRRAFPNPALLCSRVPRGTVATRAGLVLTEDGRWITDSIGPAPIAEVADVRLRGRIRIDEPEETIDEDVAVVFSVLSEKKRHNYWHWVIEGLTRAAMLRAAGVPEQVRVLVPGPVLETHRQALAVIGVDESRIVDWAGAPTRFRTVYLPSGPQHRASEPVAAAIRLVREQTAHLRAAPPTRRLWVSRRSHKRRRLRGEAELIAVAEAFGFEELVAEHLPVAEQIQLFSEAEAIAGPHGAGLGNAVFMLPKTTVVEAAPDLIKPRTRSVFLNLAAAGDQVYAYCAGPYEGIDPRRLERVLEALFT